MSTEEFMGMFIIGTGCGIISGLIPFLIGYMISAFKNILKGDAPKD